MIDPRHFPIGMWVPFWLLGVKVAVDEVRTLDGVEMVFGCRVECWWDCLFGSVKYFDVFEGTLIIIQKKLRI